MSEIGSYEAKTHLAEILDRVSKGERITITKHGTALALLVPANKPRPPSEDVIKSIRAFRRGRRLGKISLQAMKEEGRR